MCGIAGQVGGGTRSDELRRVCEDMQSALRRRGPDEKGEFFDDGAALVHARLCVVDPENGAQPMALEFGGESYVLLYNGELYNTAELRRELEGLEHRFVTRSDTEVLLHSYAEWGDGCVDRLNGIYAFAV